MSDLPPMDPSDPAVARLLERAAGLTRAEARALDAAVRARPPGDEVARQVLDDHQGWMNAWAMFNHWPDPAVEMGQARSAVYAALGQPRRWHDALEPDDSSVAWGAATAAAYAVLAAGRAPAPSTFRAAWDQVITQ